MQLIVLGMHRSGTSVLARLLNLMGAYFGPEGVGTGANQENPRGFWERRDVRELNDMVLHSVNCDWNRVASLDLAAVPAEVLADFRKRAAHIILQMDAHRPWLLKEPRLMLLFPLWRELLHAPVCIQILRNPVEVAASLQTRNEIPIEAGLALWEFYVRRSLMARDGVPTTTVTHRQLIRDPVATVAALRSRLEALGVSGLRMPSTNEIESFVVDDLYREREERTDLQPYANAPQVQLFHALEAGRPHARPGEGLSEAGLRRLRAYEAGLPPLQPKPKPKTAAPPQDSRITEALTQLLAQLRRIDGTVEKRLDEAGNRFASLTEALQAAATTNRQLADDLATRDRRIRDLERQWKAEAQRSEALVREAASREARIGEVEEQIAALESQAQARSAELATLQLALDATRDTVSEREAQLAGLRDALARADAVLRERDDTVAASEAALAKAGDALRERDAALAASRSEFSMLQGQLERRNRESQRRQQRIAEADGEIASLREAGARLRRELGAATADLAATRESLSAVRKALSTAEERRSTAEAGLESRIEEIVRLTRALVDHQDRVAILSKDLESTKERESKVLVQLEDVRAGAEREGARADQLTADLEATARALMHTRGSRSWRATSILRSAFAWMRPGTVAQVPPLAARSLLQASGKFDAKWYVERYPDVAESGMDPLDHYLSFGAAEGRDPSACFDTRAYLAHHPGLSQSGINPLVHALLAPQNEENA